MHRVLITAVICAVSLLAPSGVGAREPNTDAKLGTRVFDKSSAIVQLNSMPTSTYDGHIRGYDKTSPSKGKLNPKSAAYTKYLGYLKLEHSAFQKWLQKNVPSAKITSNYYVALNAVAVKLNGNAIGKIANSPYVKSIEYVTLYRPDMSESYKLINATPAWSAAGGRSDAGRGIKVGIIDSGIDSTHEFFDPSGFSYPSTGTWPKCDRRNSSSGQVNTNCLYTTEKVIVAKVYGNKLQQDRDFDANPIRDLGDHGSHVAGTVAGVTGKTASVHGVSIDDMSGVAPGAWLGNYNVFPGDYVEARSEDILQAVEDAVLDGMDVVNMSLSGGYRGNNDLLAMGVDNAVAAGVVFSVSAGNNGPGGFTLGSPSRARNAITVGASTNDHFVGQPVNYGSTTIGGALGDFDAFATGTYGLFDTGNNGCTSVASGASGKVALINRGTCTFSQKVANAKAAGAIGVIVVNNVAGDPTAMARTVGFDDDIPAIMIGKNEGAALRTAAPATVDINATFDEFKTANEDILAGFSSQGPTFVDYALKPDLTSVGVNVLSSIVDDDGSGDDWAFYNGTSMSSPHIAGSAAVLLDLHPGWSPAKVKSALVTTADLVVQDATTGTHDVGPMQQGGGRENLGVARNATTFFSPTSASFGIISGSQQQSTTMTLWLTNPTGSSQSFDVSATKFTPSTFGGTVPSASGAGTFSAGDGRLDFDSSITVPANSTVAFDVTVHAGQNGAAILGWLNFDGALDYHVAYGAFVP